MNENHVQQDCRLLIFTDLDGTLLDHETYSFEPALPALNVLESNLIPLIICSSKTRAEIEIIREKLGNAHPFISENGGAIFIPRDYFSHEISCDREDIYYKIVELGTPYSQLRKVFKEMCSVLPGKLKGFGDCTPSEIARLCGFSLPEAERALQREYDEPFLVEGKVPQDVLHELARRSNLQVVRGGRFYHLGNNDKGGALLRLRDIFQQQTGHRPTTVALGDSSNDLSMLKVADYPVLVRKKDGSYDSGVKLANLKVTSNSGPAGWNEALLDILSKKR